VILFFNANASNQTRGGRDISQVFKVDDIFTFWLPCKSLHLRSLLRNCAREVMPNAKDVTINFPRPTLFIDKDIGDVRLDCSLPRRFDKRLLVKQKTIF
jgi:hypothetical protein